MGETDPRVEIVNRLERAAMAYQRLGKLTRDDEKTREMRKATIAELADARRAILAALDAARPVEPPLTPETAPTMADMQRMTDDLLTDPVAMDAYMDANPLPVEPMQEYDATDAIERAIANWSTISDEPPVDEEVAGVARRLHMLADEGRIDRSIPNIIERQQAEIARLTKERDKARKHGAVARIRENAAEDARISASDRATAAEAEIADLRARLATAAEDTNRLDFLDAMNKALNEHYGTKYRWRLILNHNVNRLVLGHMVVDLHDSEGGNNGLQSCRDAIDERRRARAALASIKENQP